MFCRALIFVWKVERFPLSWKGEADIPEQMIVWYFMNFCILIWMRILEINRKHEEKTFNANE